MISYTNGQMCRLIDDYIHSARDREILKDRLINGYTFEALAEKHDLSVRHVKNIVYRQQDILFKHVK